MADQVATLTHGSLSVSQITSAPVLTHARDLLRRAESVDSATCGWVNGDKDDALVCADPYRQPCLWNTELYVVGCCAASTSSGCDWKTSCVPYASVNYGCDSSCQKNDHNLICPSDRPLCAKATFAGPSGYSYYSCTSKDALTETVYLTWQGGDATVQNLPRYYDAYYSSTSTTQSTSTSTKTGATSTSTKSGSKTVSWLEEHKFIVIGAVVGVVIVVILLFVGCCCFMRRKRNRVADRGIYIVAPQQEAVPLTQAYKPYQPQTYSNH